MKNNREMLNKEVAELRTFYELPDDTAALDVFKHNFLAKYQKYVAFCDKPRTDDEKKTALAPVKRAVDLYNDEARCQRIESLMDMSAKDAIKDFIRTQRVSGYKVVKKKYDEAHEAEFCIDPDDKVAVDSYDVISAMCSVELENLLDSVCIWADNMAKFKYHDDSAHISTNSMHPNYIAMRQSHGWDISHDENSTRNLLRHLNEVVRIVTFKADLSPVPGEEFALNTTDMKYICDGIFTAKDIADTEGIIQLHDEKTLLRYVFRAIYTRYNAKAYKLVSKMRSGDSNAAPRTMQPNKDAGENPMMPEFTPVTMPKAGPVTTGKAPAKKPATKKPATKK